MNVYAPIPLKLKPTWRVRLAAVRGFSVGVLGAEVLVRAASAEEAAGRVMGWLAATGNTDFDYKDAVRESA